MLVGLENNTVITGAFSGGGGVCPMLAAHREGDRTHCYTFPEAWDRFTGVHGRHIIRQATQYEIDILRAEIEASMIPHTSELAEAIAEHHAAVAARRRRERFFAGEPVDLGGAIVEHKQTARSRRSREAVDVGLDWLFQDTLVLPDDFETESGQDESERAFDFDAAERQLARR